MCSNGDLRNHLKSFEFVKTLSQVGEKLSLVGGKVLKSDVEVEDLYFFEFCVKPIFQGGKNKEKFENVPKFPRLISWCMDIIRGSHLITPKRTHRCTRLTGLTGLTGLIGLTGLTGLTGPT